MNSRIIIGIVIGLIVVLVAGVFIGAFFVSPSKTGKSNEAQVSGTVSGATDNVIDFANTYGNITASAAIINGRYSVSLPNGQSYVAMTPAGAPSYYPPNASEYYTASATFYVPSGVSTFTQNLILSPNY